MSAVVAVFRLWLLGNAMLLAFATTASAQREPGRTLVEERCAMCHAIGSRGNSPHPAAMPFRTLGNSYDLGKLQTAFERGDILPAHPDMPLFKLDRRTARGVVNYIRSIQE
jgi:mono/diheme cytochrome c family protein